LIETPKHKEAFEIYYALGVNRSLPRLRQELTKRWTGKIPSLTTLKNWSSAFNWQYRVQQRDIENAQKLKEKINLDVVNSKADYRKTIHAMHQMLKKSLKEYVERNKPAEIKTVRDLARVADILEKLVTLDMKLVGETEEAKEIRVVIEKVRKAINESN